MLREVRARVADGTGLAEAMAQHPRAFNELAVSMVRAGQEGGFLEDVLRRIADFTEHQEDLKAKVIGALAYPVFLADRRLHRAQRPGDLLRAAVRADLREARREGRLPGLTMGLVATSHFMQRQGIVAAGRPGRRRLSASARWVATTGRPAAAWTHWRLRLPGAGSIYLQLALSRFTRILGTLLHNGIPILQALRIAKDSTGNRVLTLAIEQSAENITAGDSLAAPLAACTYFPRDVVEMVAVGEESNNLEKVLLEHRQRPGEAHRPAAGSVRPPAGAGDAAGHGRRHAAGRGRPAAAGVQDGQCRGMRACAKRGLTPWNSGGQTPFRTGS